jgi:ABC-type sugar transport system ATPase subunit
MSVLLELQNIEKHFDGVHALRQLRLQFASGEVHVLMGENGAGKSTAAKIIAGVVQPDAGDILLRGQKIRLRTPLEAQQQGIGIVFQELDLFPYLTVAENIVIGNRHVERSAFVDFAKLAQFCKPYLASVGLGASPNVLLADLPIGQRQLVAIARALSMDAQLIVLDEPTSSLSDQDAQRLFDLIRALKNRGVTIIYVSHKMHEIFQIADRITVLRDGQYVGTRVASQTTANELISMMVGRELFDEGPRQTHRTSRLLLAARHLSTARLRDISFELHAGEVLGVAGLVGAGRSELGAALFGLDRLASGTIQLNGQQIRPRSGRDAIAMGIGLVPEDRKQQGLMMQMSVKENCTLSVLSRLSRGGFVRSGQELARTGEALKQTRIKAASPQALVSTLSGGNQQKVLLARWLEVNPEVLFLDDPTRGIDVGAKRDIYALIDAMAKREKGIIMVSSELPELLRCCDRIIVLHDGRCTGCVDATTATQEEIMVLATRSNSESALGSSGSN